jgi:hypothetical protein
LAALAAMTPALLLPLASTAHAATFTFSTGNPDGKVATASRPDTGGQVETETGDDFVLGTASQIPSATFTGLVPAGATVSQVRVEIYRVFPLDSDTTRTITVPTRANSPSDVEFADRDSANGSLTFQTTVLAPSFTAANSVDVGIHPSPNQLTHGEGPVTGQEVLFSVTFNPPFSLPAGHYFFVPQVALSAGHFLWLSAPKPIVAPGTPFNPDLQTWIRNEPLAPDWLRVGTDIIGAGAFNAAFSLVIVAAPPACTTTLTGNVTGPLTVGAGQTLCLNSARVTGGVTVQAGGSLVVRSSNVDGGIVATSPLFFSLCGSKVTAIATNPTLAVSVSGATGAVELGDPANGCPLNQFSGGVTLDRNQSGLTMNGNQMAGNISVTNNTGGSITVGGNLLSGSLSCTGNVPNPTNGGSTNNAFGGKTGQCAGL